MTNTLYYGDNLAILREMPAEMVDLVYLDPPFNSNRTYNVLFKEKTGTESQAQIQAFDDTWTWSQESDALLREMTQEGSVPLKVAEAIEAMARLLGENDMLAYLVMMTPRLVELHRVLKPTGSLYLHCDPTASHYLKIILDSVFGANRYFSEISWKRTTAHSDGAQGRENYGHVRDILLFYSKSENHYWNVQYTPYSESYQESFYRHIEPETGRRYGLDNISGPGGAAKGNPEYEFLGVTRHWRFSRERMETLYAQGRIVQTNPGTVPRQKRYLDEMPGVPLQDDWQDIPAIGSQARERLGYPTQKPVALLERIINASSNPGDVVLDPFCGCGTTISAAQKLRRNWIGIDISFLSVDLIRKRLIDEFGPDIEETYSVVGIPQDVEGAKALFQHSPFEFERWAVSMVGGTPNEKQVGDKGIDGIARFSLDYEKEIGRIVISVKGGGSIGPDMVRDLDGTVTQTKAQMGILATLSNPTPKMIDAARHSGTFRHEITGRDYPRVQIITIPELLAKKRPDMPTTFLPYLKAKGVPNATQPRLLE